MLSVSAGLSASQHHYLSPWHCTCDQCIRLKPLCFLMRTPLFPPIDTSVTVPNAEGRRVPPLELRPSFHDSHYHRLKSCHATRKSKPSASRPHWKLIPPGLGARRPVVILCTGELNPSERLYTLELISSSYFCRKCGSRLLHTTPVSRWLGCD